MKLCQGSFKAGEVATEDDLGMCCMVCYRIQSHELFLLVGIFICT